jgi:hypothetical protein
MEEIKNTAENAQLGIGGVSGSKLERIAQTKKLIEEGRIFFDPIHHENNKNLIIGCDFGSGKDESIKHIFYYR